MQLIITWARPHKRVSQIAWLALFQYAQSRHRWLNWISNKKTFLTCYLHEYSCIFANPWDSKLIITWPCPQQSEAAWLHSSLLCHKQCSCPSCHFHCQNLSQQLINLSAINQSCSIDLTKFYACEWCILRCSAWQEQYICKKCWHAFSAHHFVFVWCQLQVIMNTET